MTDTLKVAGGNIRRLRKERGLTIEDLAERANLNAKYLGGVERGSENLSLRTLDQVADALKVRPFELLLPFPAGSLTEKLESIVRTADARTQAMMTDLLEVAKRWPASTSNNKKRTS